MTATVSRRVGMTLALALLVGVGVSTAPAASGYPPGTKLTLVSSRASVAVSQKVTLKVFHAGPGCSVKFTFGSQHDFRVAHSGKAEATFTSTATSGLIHASAMTYNCAYHESASTTIKASSPKITLPSHAVKKHWFRVSISRFPARHSIHLRVYNSHYAKSVLIKTGSTGSASSLFKVPDSGSYVVVASGGGASASTVLHVNNH